MKKAILNFEENTANEEVLWFYPPKTIDGWPINIIYIEENILETITNDENFPDPDFYFIGFINKNKHFQTPEKKYDYNNLKTQYSNNGDVSDNMSKNICFSSNEKAENIQELTKKYKKIRDVDEIFEENDKLCKNIDQIIREKRHYSARKLLPDTQSKNIYLKKNYSKNEKNSTLKKKFYSFYEKNRENSGIAMQNSEENSEVYLNQLSLSTIASHNWRNQGSRGRIMKMVPEFSQQNYNFDNICNKLKKHSKPNKNKINGKHTSLSIRKSPCRFENEGIMNTSLSDENYTKLLYKWDKSHENLYGLDLDGYKKIKQLAMVDQIDITNPNTENAKQSFYLIMNERKNIRNKINKKYVFSQDLSKVNNEKRQDTTTPKRIFLKKKMVIKNSGLMINQEAQKQKIKPKNSELDCLKTSNFIPIIAKAIRQFKKLKKKSQ